MNTAIISQVGQSAGIGFAVPIDVDQAQPLGADSLGSYRARLSGGAGPLENRVNDLLQLEAAQRELLVTNVAAGEYQAARRRPPRRSSRRTTATSPATSSRPSTSNRPSTRRILSLILNQKRPGEAIQLDVLRDGRTVRVSVTLGEASNRAASKHLRRHAKRPRPESGRCAVVRAPTSCLPFAFLLTSSTAKS